MFRKCSEVADILMPWGQGVNGKEFFDSAGEVDSKNFKACSKYGFGGFGRVVSHAIASNNPRPPPKLEGPSVSLDCRQ